MGYYYPLLRLPADLVLRDVDPRGCWVAVVFILTMVVVAMQEETVHSAASATESSAVMSTITFALFSISRKTTSYQWLRPYNRVDALQEL